jgi:hypothetical protein
VDYLETEIQKQDYPYRVGRQFMSSLQFPSECWTPKRVLCSPLEGQTCHEHVDFLAVRKRTVNEYL